MQESKGKQALWVAPRSMADIEDEVVRTVQSSIMTDRGINVKRDLQVYQCVIFQMDTKKNGGAVPCLIPVR